MKENEELEIYSNGFVHCSICTNIENIEEIERQVNMKNPTGIGSRWKISEEPTFRSGQPNPCVCEQKSTHRHYLMVC